MIWVRQSTAAARNDKNADLEYQRQQMKELERTYGVSCECFESHGKGESVEGSDAPVGLEKLICDITAGSVAMVVVPSADRLSRSYEHFRSLARMLTSAGSCIVVGEPTDCSLGAGTSGLNA